MQNKQQNLSIENIFSWKFVFVSIIVAYFFFIYTDYWGFSGIGFIISLFIFLIIILVSLKDFPKALSLALYSIFLSARVPRNLTFIMSDLRVEQKVEFHSMINSNFFGFSFAQWIFLFLGIIAVIKYLYSTGKLSFFKDTRNLLFLTFIVMILLYVATLLDTIFFRNVFNIRKFISDHRLFITLISSLIVGNYFVKVDKKPIYTLAKVIIFIGLTSGFKTIFFIISDSINHSLYKDFSTESYLLVPLFFTVIFIFSKKLNYFQIILISFIIFMGGFSISRGDILLFVLDLLIFIFLIISSLKQTKITIKRTNILIILLIIIILFPSILLYHLNKASYIFLIYKINFFSKEIWSGNISHSPKIRIYEFKNIFQEGVDLIYPLFIGKGFGGYFTYNNYPANFKFDLFDYSKNELAQQTYFNPHTFINFYLLKGGMILLLFYLFILIYMLSLGINSLNSKDVSSKLIALFTCFYFLFALSMFWRPIYIFLFGILINVLIKIGDEKDTQFKEVKNG